MPDKAQPARQFEDVLETIVTCRSVVKYNSMLNEEQKKELVADIDATLQFLRSRPYETLPQAGLSAETQPDLPLLEVQVPDQQKLEALYRMYHAYLGLQQNNLGTFLARFNEVMGALNELQELLAQQDGYVSVKQPIEHVSSFIADLYYIFVEFISALSQILEANDVHLDTEEVEAMQGHYIERDEQPRGLRSLAPLIKVFEAHQRLNARKGSVSGRVNGSAAFLEFLEESLTGDFSKRDEVIAQLNNAIALLRDLSQLLSGYELAISTLLKRQ